MRLETMRELEARARTLLGEILGDAGGFGMRYVCSFNPSGKEPGEALREALARVREAERRRGYTMAGPHYDDVQIFLEASEIRRFGSQGRKRLAALVLKLSQALTILDKRGEKPVVLLDDIFSELDRETAERVREHLADSYQSFITTPRPEEFGARARRRALLVERARSPPVRGRARLRRPSRGPMGRASPAARAGAQGPRAARSSRASEPRGISADAHGEKRRPRLILVYFWRVC